LHSSGTGWKLLAVLVIAHATLAIVPAAAAPTAYPMQSGNGFKLLGTLSNVPSGSNAEFVWSNLAPGAEYEWYAVVKDAEGESTSPTWSFTTSAQHTIVATAGAGGSIALSGSVSVTPGADQTFTITPNELIAGGKHLTRLVMVMR